LKLQKFQRAGYIKLLFTPLTFILIQKTHGWILNGLIMMIHIFMIGIGNGIIIGRASERLRKRYIIDFL
jgi:hypothetical protein